MSNPDSEFEAIFNAIKTARKAIIDKHGKSRGIADSMQCPVCKKGQLNYSIAQSNGHIHGRCNTGGCVSWME